MIRFEDGEGLEPVSPDTMTPMIDVILSLIAFMMLMINAPLLTMDIDLPDVEKQEYTASSQVKPINLLILPAKQQWRLEDRLITSRNDLKTQLSQLVSKDEQTRPVLLSIDQSSMAQRMVDTLDVLDKLGITNTQIALEQQSGSGE